MRNRGVPSPRQTRRRSSRPRYSEAVSGCRPERSRHTRRVSVRADPVTRSRCQPPRPRPRRCHARSRRSVQREHRSFRCSSAAHPRSRPGTDDERNDERPGKSQRQSGAPDFHQMGAPSRRTGGRRSSSHRVCGLGNTPGTGRIGSRRRAASQRCRARPSDRARDSRSNPDRSVATPIDRATNVGWTFQGGCALPK
jgi:hypothetical protein